jgi:methyltransferase (TIGR00027 family)
MTHLENHHRTVGKGPSKMAEGMALHRTAESMLPEGDRICYDPYAVHFVNPEILKFAEAHPAEAQAKLEEMEALFPGLGNSIRARVRYFDDYIEQKCREGLDQLVILGAGYDTRAYRLAALRDKVRIFEVDHPVTQELKKEKVLEIFGALPDHVVYVPVDFETGALAGPLMMSGFSDTLKTLFVMEGLVMYIPPESVDETLAFIAESSGPGNAVIFDYYPASVVDGSCNLTVAQNILMFTRMAGEPLQFGIPDGEVVRFLIERGFVRVHNVSGGEYRRLLFHGKNTDRQVCDLLSFVSAEVA